MKQVIQISAAAFLFLAFTHPADAQSPPVAQTETDEASPLQERADQVVAFINGQTGHEELFTDAFLRAVPPQQLRTITNQLTSEFGAAVSVESLDPSSANHAALSIRMERAIAKGGIAIDPASENRVSELLLQSFVPLDDSIEKIETDLRGLNGTVTWWYGPVDGTTPPAASSGSSSQMPIGSTFKLYVLATLAREVAERKRAWSDSVTLRELRSFPSGMMQDWPKAAPVTLHTLASLMISISDN
ncbi:MAG: serine hydrolase, partial [Erythrobacter sp.]